MPTLTAERWRLRTEGAPPTDPLGLEQGGEQDQPAAAAVLHLNQKLVLRTVGEENVEGMDFPAVAALIKAAGRPLVLTFRKPEKATAADGQAAAAAEEEVAASAAGKDRLAALSDAFGMGGGKVGHMAAASAADAFTESTLALARAQPECVREVESALDKFVAAPFTWDSKTAAVASSARRLALRPMPRWQREMAHEMAERYGLTTGSYGTEPNRRVDCFRSAKSAPPSVRLVS